MLGSLKEKGVWKASPSQKFHKMKIRNEIACQGDAAHSVMPSTWKKDILNKFMKNMIEYREKWSGIYSSCITNGLSRRRLRGLSLAYARPGRASGAGLSIGSLHRLNAATHPVVMQTAEYISEPHRTAAQHGVRCLNGPVR